MSRARGAATIIALIVALAGLRVAGAGDGQPATCAQVAAAVCAATAR